MKLATRVLINKLAGEEGFEPSLTGPEPGVLPLDYSPVCLALPPYPLKTKEGSDRNFGQQIQSFLPNPSPVDHLHTIRLLLLKSTLPRLSKALYYLAATARCGAILLYEAHLMLSFLLAADSTVLLYAPSQSIAEVTP